MNVLWFSWKDSGHPLAGGAETISGEIRKRLAKDGHNVRLITAKYPNSPALDKVDGIEVFRTGGKFSVYAKAFFLFRKQMRSWPDLIIDEMNTIPFGCAFYTKKKTVLLTYQLARQIWFYQIFFPLSFIGYLLEPFYVFLLSRAYRTVLTESESTRRDLARFGFKKARVKVFRVGIKLKPLDSLPLKKDTSKILILGSIRPMKGTLSAIKGFEYARDHNDKLELSVAGDTSDKYAGKVLSYLKQSRHKAAIQVLGRVSAKERLELMLSSSLILVTSVKEGWGLIVTEANSQGTPAIAYDTDGLRDSVVDGKTGLLVKPRDERALGRAINDLVADKQKYQKIREAAWSRSKQYTFDNSYSDFLNLSEIKSTKP